MITQMISSTKWSTALYPAYSHLAESVRSNHTLFQAVFGFRPMNLSSHFSQYWDWSTLVLKRVLDQQFRPGMTLLDMGTGPVGVLAIYAVLHLKPETVVAARSAFAYSIVTSYVLSGGRLGRDLSWLRKRRGC